MTPTKNPSLVLVGPRPHAGLKKLLSARSGLRVVAVDGGVAQCLRAGRVPDAAVGDWDSLKNSKKLLKRLRPETITTLPHAKNRSDLAHGLRAAARMLRRDPAATVELKLVGFGGGRLDHLLAGLTEVSAFSSHPPKAIRSIEWEDASAEIRFLSTKLPAFELAGLKRGRVVSVFAWNSVVRGLTLSGFAYPLRDATLRPSSQGLSNEVTKTRCAISFHSGRLLVVMPL